MGENGDGKNASQASRKGIKFDEDEAKSRNGQLWFFMDYLLMTTFFPLFFRWIIAFLIYLPHSFCLFGLLVRKTKSKTYMVSIPIRAHARTQGTQTKSWDTQKCQNKDEFMTERLISFSFFFFFFKAGVSKEEWRLRLGGQRSNCHEANGFYHR